MRMNSRHNLVEDRLACTLYKSVHVHVTQFYENVSPTPVPVAEVSDVSCLEFLG